jgi:hypothetical protein
MRRRPEKADMAERRRDGEGGEVEEDGEDGEDGERRAADKAAPGDWGRRLSAGVHDLALPDNDPELQRRFHRVVLLG